MTDKTTETPINYIYSRVSTLEQHAENQSNMLKEKYKNLNPVVVEENFTGSSIERPEFTDLVDNKLKPGSSLIVFHVSRLGRNAAEVLQVAETLKARGVSIIVHQLKSLDITDPVGNMMFTMLTGFAQLEKEMMLERQRLGIERAKKEGKYRGRAKVASTKVDAAITLVNSGMSKEQAAKEVGLGVATLYRKLKELKQQPE